MNDIPIGMFDSGIGGLTVARSVLDQLSHRQMLYIGDIADSPYGPRGTAEIQSLALGIMDELVDRGVKLLVIAYSTASTVVLHDARKHYALGRGAPVIETIHPVARTVIRVTRSGKMGLVATHGTVDPRAYDDAPQAVPGTELVSQVCPRLAELVEREVTTDPGVLGVAGEYLVPTRAAGVDTLILGYTHYLLLAGLISYITGRDVTLVTPSGETVRGVYRALAGKDLLCEPEVLEPRHDLASTGDLEVFFIPARRFLGPEVIAVEYVAFAPGAAGASAGLPHPPSPPTSHQGSA